MTNKSGSKLLSTYSTGNCFCACAQICRILVLNSYTDADFAVNITYVEINISSFTRLNINQILLLIIRYFEIAHQEVNTNMVDPAWAR